MDPSEASVRKKGIVRFVLFGPLAAAIAFAVYWFTATYRHSPFHGELAIVLALPGAFALVGLLEAVSGVPFRQFSARWNQLAGWQRGIIGLLVAAIAAAVAFGVFVTFAAAIDEGRM